MTTAHAEAEPSTSRARSPAIEDLGPRATDGATKPVATPLLTVPEPAPGESVVELLGATVAGLEVIRALWRDEGGEVLLHGRRPFLDVTGHAAFDHAGSLTGVIEISADVTMLGLQLGTVRWQAQAVDDAPLSLPAVTSRGATLQVDMSALAGAPRVTLASGAAAPAEGGTVAIDLPGDAVTDGEPLSARVAEVFATLRGWDVTGFKVHRDAPVADAPAFVADQDLFFAPGRYGVEKSETAALLDAALWAALAGLTGPVEPTPPAPRSDALVPRAEGRGPAGGDAAAARASVGRAPALTAPEPTAGARAGGMKGDTRAPVKSASADAKVGEPGNIAGEEAPRVELIMQEAPVAPTAAARARGGVVAARAGTAGAAARDMPSADATADSARAAVEEPATETVARAQEAVAAELGERPPPSPEIVELAERIRATIRDNRPEGEGELLRTDPTKQAREAGATVTGAVEAQTAEAGAAYDQMGEPSSGKPALTPAPAEAQSPAVPGMGVDAASAAPDPVPPESRSLDADVAATDTRIGESGIDTRVTREIPDGPFAEARTARGELGALAERTPAEIAAEEQSTIDGAQTEMARLQLAAMASMREAREGAVGDVGEGVTDMTGQEELTRDTVSSRAQAIFTSAEQRVESMLEPVSRVALEKWDAGLTRLSREFNGTLDRVQRWIDERHSGAVGTLLAIGDAIVGLPSWVMREYHRAELEFGDGVVDLLIDISRDVNTVVVAAQAVIQTARDDIDVLFDQMETEFPEWAAEERVRFGGMLDGLDSDVADAQTSFVRDVRERAITAVNEAHAAVEAKREEAGGLIGQVISAIEEFIDDPARAIINGLLRLVGIAPGEFWALIAQIEQVIDDIAADPENFINNLVTGVKLGFEQFFDNFGTHLLTSFWNWLFSELETPIAMPKTTDPFALMSFALELMGITWPNIREILVKHVGPEGVELLEAAWELLSTLIERGAEGIVEMIKDMLSPDSVVGMILDAAIEYLTETLIVQVATYLFSLLNPVGAVAQAVRLIYQVCAWIFRNAARIFSFVQAVVGGIANVIAGNISGMAATVERALVTMIVVAIDFLAGLLGLSGLPAEVAEVIKRMQTYVLSLVERVIVFFVTRARALLARMGLGGEEEEEGRGDANEDYELGTTVRFTGGGESHHLFFQVAGDDATLMVASTPTAIIDKIADWRGKVSNLPESDEEDLQANTKQKLDELATVAAQTDAEADELAAGFLAAAASQDDGLEPPSDDALKNRQRAIARMMDQLFDIFGDRDDESSRLADIAAQLPIHGRQRAEQIATSWASHFSPEPQHLPSGSTEHAAIWNPASLAATAITAGLTHLSREPTQRELLPFYEAHARSTASSPSFFTWAFVRAEGIRDGFQNAMGQAYASAMRGEGTDDLDVVDTELRKEISKLKYVPGKSHYGTFATMPATGEGVDPALRERTDDIIRFFKAMAVARVYRDYQWPRLQVAWERPANRDHLHTRFRNALLRGVSGGYHEWIPTDMTLAVVSHAVQTKGTARSGVRYSLQWINAHHHLRSETNRVYARVGKKPMQDLLDRPLAQAGIMAHAGAAWVEETGRRGAGLIGQEAFHDELRGAFVNGIDFGDQPSAFITRLLRCVAELLWDPDDPEAGIPASRWNEPIGRYFDVKGGGPRVPLTFGELRERQWKNIEAIDGDFTDARKNLDKN